MRDGDTAAAVSAFEAKLHAALLGEMAAAADPATNEAIRDLKEFLDDLYES